MSNPFKSGESRLDPDELWICPEKAWEQMEDSVHKKLDTVVLGVKGSGKSTLLSKFFSAEYRKSAFTESKRIVFSAVLAHTEDGNKLCELLIRELCNAAYIHLGETERNHVRAYLAELRECNETPKMQFIDLCKWLGGDAPWEINQKYPLPEKYSLLLVMDAFERFVSSPRITQDQHDMLRDLVEEKIMFCIVATDYDLQESSLPPEIKNSLFLQKFQTKITLQGFSRKDTRDFVSGKMSAKDPVQLSESQVDFLYDLTGGIPLLFEMGAHYMYQNLKDHTGIKRGAFTNKLLTEALPTMKTWFKFFTPEYVTTLTAVLSNMPATQQNALQHFYISPEDTVGFDAASLLVERGFLRTHNSSIYQCNSLLLQKYAMQEYLPNIVPRQAEEKPKEKCYNVFISYKHEEDDKPTKDAQIALDLYETLCDVEGLVPFLDKKEIPNFRNNDFNDAIFAALKTSRAHIIVCTNATYLENSRYIKKERRFYNGLIDNHKKEEGSVYLVVDERRKSLLSSIPEEILFFVDVDDATPAGIDILVHKLRQRILAKP